jgi:THAP4-like, heme-binding beta-barrel domain
MAEQPPGAEPQQPPSLADQPPPAGDQPPPLADQPPPTDQPSSESGPQFEIEFIRPSAAPEPQPLPEPHPDLAPLSFLLGRWEGAGVGGYPTIESFRFGQELSFSHNGKPFLIYSSRTWLLDEEGRPGRPLGMEVGFWRPQPDNGVELLLAHPTGITEIYLGTVTGTRIELSTDIVTRTASAKEVTAGHRLYGLVGDDLAYAYDMAAVGQGLQPHLSAQLKRIAAA